MKKGNAIISVITIFIILVVVNFLAARHSARIDLTDDNIYTLSDATKSILKNLDDVVTLRVYFTEDIPPSLAALRRDVDDMLSEFKSVSGKNVQIEFIDPNSSPIEEQKLALMGIPPLQLNVINRDKQEVAKVYLGMAILYEDRQQVIPVINRVENLEYDLAEAIIKVSSKELPKIAWWQSESDGEGKDTFYYMKEGLGRRYSVEDVSNDTLPHLDAKNYAALILISPRMLTDDELFALDQYVMSGGRVMALIDRFDITPSLMMEPIQSNAVGLLNHYGISIENSIVLDESNAMASFAGWPVTYHLPYPFWPDVRAAQFNRRDPMVANLETVVLPWTSPISLSRDGEGGEAAEVLARSSASAAAQPGDNIQLDPQSATETLVRSKREEQNLIVLLKGPFGSYFTEGRMPPRGTTVISEGQSSAQIFAVGTSKWISDRFLQNFPSNAALFENAVDAFAMGDALIGIRSRENTSRPIVLLSDRLRAAVKYTNMAIGPIVLIAAGAAAFMLRRRRYRAMKSEYCS